MLAVDGYQTRGGMVLLPNYIGIFVTSPFYSFCWLTGCFIARQSAGQQKFSPINRRATACQPTAIFTLRTNDYVSHGTATARMPLDGLCRCRFVWVNR
ncbi:hypothetical protein KCP76_20765 [Salmonella enterica subsp. enterica serovar Weltevreden]|nr:hypothetical protein KCP76_20765 [Salmonella enterica subsp. enterica serovar Weltevreden]